MIILNLLMIIRAFFAVGMLVAPHPPHRPGRAVFPYPVHQLYSFLILLVLPSVFITTLPSVFLSQLR